MANPVAQLLTSGPDGRPDVSGSAPTLSLQSEANSSPVVYPKPSPIATPPITANKVKEKTKLPIVNQTRLATPSPRVAKSREELAAIRTQIKQLEKQTGLNLLPYILGGELARVRQRFSDLNINKYYLLLCLLVYGFDNTIMRASIGQNHADYIIDDNFINDFQSMINDPLLTEILKKTPAYKKGAFDDIGQLGNVAAEGDRLENNPVTGPTRYTPSLVTNMLEKIHPGSVSAIERVCNTIRTRAYLSMPQKAFGSIQRIVRIVNGAVRAFNRLVNDFYKMLSKYIKKVYAWINGIIADIQKKLMQIIEQIIPLDLLCLILDTMQVILDDLNFFTSLFNVSGPILNYLNIVQTFVNTTSNFIQNPFTTLKAYLPPQVTTIIDTIEQIGTDPEGFIADNLANYGLSWVNTALQGDIVGAMIEKYGANYMPLKSPLGDVMSKAQAIWNRYSADGSSIPDLQDIMDPNFYNNGEQDLFGTDIDGGNLYRNLKENFISLSQDISALPGDIKRDLGQFGSDVEGTAKKFFDTVAKPFKSNTQTQSNSA
jgi:hypothetical protein